MVRDPRRPFRPAAADDGGDVEDLRPHDWVYRAGSLLRAARSVGGAVTALVAIVGALAGAGKYALKWAGIATTAGVADEIARATRPLADAKVDREAHDAKIDARLSELSAQMKALGDASKKTARPGRRPSPAQHATDE